MANFPKLWGGVSPVGEGKLRGLELLDTPFLTASGPGFVARKGGAFSEVDVELPLAEGNPPQRQQQYFASGLVGSRSGVRKTFGTPNVQRQFTPAKALGQPWGEGRFFRSVGDCPDTPQTLYCKTWFYPSDTGGWWTYVKATRSFYDGGATEEKAFTLMLSRWRRLSAVSEIEFYSQGFSDYYGTKALAYDTLPIGYYRENGIWRAAGAWVSGQYTGESDWYGFPLFRVRVVCYYDDMATYKVSILQIPQDTKGRRTYTFGFGVVISPGVFIVPVAELLTPPGFTDDGAHIAADYESSIGRMIFYKTEDWGATWNVWGVDSLNKDLPYQGLLYHQASAFNDQQNRALVDMCTSMRWIVISPTVLILICIAPCRSEKYGTINYNTGRYDLTDIGRELFDARDRAYREAGQAAIANGATQEEAELAGKKAEAAVTPYDWLDWATIRKISAKRSIDGGKTFSDLPPLPLDPDKAYDLDGVCLRDNVILLRAAEGLAGVDRPVTLILSMNGGDSWEILDPKGLPPLKNQFIGYFKVVAVDESKGTPQSTVVVSGWDQKRRAYYLYVTTDDGRTWRRRARISSSTTFRRMDHDTAASSAGDTDNFGTIAYVGSPQHPAPLDVAAPWRYDATIPYEG